VPARFPLQGFDVAKKALLEFLDAFKEGVDVSDREALRCVARTSLRTKLYQVGRRRGRRGRRVRGMREPGRAGLRAGGGCKGSHGGVLALPARRVPLLTMSTNPAC
jgi:hypothetical protein